MSIAVPFDTLAFMRELETAGIPSAHAEAQAKAICGAFQRVEESRLQDLATKGDVLRLEKEIELAKAELRKDIESAKVEIIKWVIVTGIAILGGMTAINRFAPSPAPVYYQPPTQEMRQPAPPSVLPVPPPVPSH